MEVIKAGNPEAAFPLGFTFTCNNCGCQFRLNATDSYDVIAFEGSEQVTKSVFVTCPHCLADVSERRIYTPAISEIRSPDGQQAVSVGRLSAEVHLPDPRPTVFQRGFLESRPLSELKP